MFARSLSGVTLSVGLFAAAVVAQRSDAFLASRDHPAIRYSKTKESNPVSQLAEAVARGERTLAFSADAGYLPALLDALNVPVESQVLVYSATSLQARRISKANPRAIYFNDSVSVGYVRGGELLEVAVHDPKQGTVFYAVHQAEVERPVIGRDNSCLSCHLSWDTRAVPGMMVLTTHPRRSDADYANGGVVDHRVPLDERWGGWFVTGKRVPASLGNLDTIIPTMSERGPRPMAAPSSVSTLPPRGYLAATSDVVALMLLEHQAHAVNLITRAGWEARIASPHVRAAVDELVDYLLFVDEAPLPHAVVGSSGFTERFSKQGPRDPQGRSLRELDLNTRLMRYPLSYMIYSSGFAGLPDEVRNAARARLDDVLSGKVSGPKYAHLTPALRRALQEIVASTLGAG